MTLQDYQAAVDPKVLGTWNVHSLLEGADLNFFIMLSSISGIAGNGADITMEQEHMAPQLWGWRSW